MKYKLLIGWFLLSTVHTFAQQLDIKSDIRSRFENRHGFGTLIPDTMKSANFISQRSRFVIDYSNKNIKLRISPQNVKVWGDVGTTSKSDLNLGFHEAYAEILLNKNISFKAGRQEINYDDSRIFGSLDWAMQARSHDALIFKINPDTNNTIHVGLAYNANAESNYYSNYLVPQYKAMQWLWYHGKFKDIGISFLALNNGMPYLTGTTEKVAYSQTVGPRFTLKKDKLKADATGYMQLGKIAKNNVNAVYLSANVGYQLSKEFNAGIGFEYLSGKATNDVSTDIKSFNPIYGTNHKFNGFMDYFYVGNHSNSVGLTDIYANFNYAKNKFSAKFCPHYFMTAADLYKGTVKQNKALGTELDFTFGYKVVDNVSIEAGYSQMFATSSMEVLKGGNKSNTNNWFYLTLFVNPNLLSFKK